MNEKFQIQFWDSMVQMALIPDRPEESLTKNEPKDHFLLFNENLSKCNVPSGFDISKLLITSKLLSVKYLRQFIATIKPGSRMLKVINMFNIFLQFIQNTTDENLIHDII